MQAANEVERLDKILDAIKLSSFNLFFASIVYRNRFNNFEKFSLYF